MIKIMFSGKKPQATAVGGLTYIAPGTRLNGETSFAGDALIGGDIQGTIRAQASITIEPQGKINGEVVCHEMKVSGFFSGKLKCERLIITNEGTVEGEVTSVNMEIQEGGQFIGSRVKEQLDKIINEAPAKLADKSEKTDKADKK